ncbi:histidinol-phosphate aminotransferase family protein [Cyanobacteria bacterium FACHB-DQ100]|nr:histidinol-phosphate aminotransferase family protein [Cyanobacteria bacterium FACHB-DQ100]
MLILTEQEKAIAASIAEMKSKAGSHSPSVFTLFENLPELRVKIDACYLSNPYATELFLNFLRRELIDTGRLRDFLEFYPSQNQVIASALEEHLDVPTGKIFVGNGAAEIIQAVIHNFTTKKILVNIPTFSSYYEFAKDDVQVLYFKLDKDNNFRLDIDSYLQTIKREKPDTVVLINPNNPDGGYIGFAEIQHLLEELREVDNIIIDESFIHFSFEERVNKFRSALELSRHFNNLIIIKSMSKDFGIAGIRAGYAVMSEAKVNYLLKNGYLWNVSGLAQYFFNLYAREEFSREYEKVRVQYVQEAQTFFKNLSKIPSIKVYPSMANFALVELIDGSRAADFFIKMLVQHHIYTRSCSDKIGLDGQFVRIAARTKGENQAIINAINSIYSLPLEYDYEVAMQAA